MTEWWRDIYDALKEADIKQVVYVPDAGHAKLIDACIADNDIRAVPLTTEEEGIAMLAGAWLGGQRGVLLMQSSGVGNCINMLSLVQTCRFPLLMIVTQRGEWAEFNPWQIPMGNAAGPAIERVIGVDTVPPGPEVQRELGRTEFVRADIRNPLIAKVIAQASVDTVVHMNVIATPLGAGGRTAMVSGSATRRPWVCGGWRSSISRPATSRCSLSWR